MWTDGLLTEILIRQKLTEVRQAAARAHLIRSVRPRPARRSVWAGFARLQRLIQSIAPVAFQ